LWNAVTVFLLAFFAVLIAVFLNMPARFVSDHTPLAHGWTLLLTVLLLLVLGVAVGWLAGPRIAQQATDLMDTLPKSLERVRGTIESIPGGSALVSRVTPAGQGSGADFNVVSRITGTVSTVWDVAVKVVFVLFLGLFLASSPRKYRDGAIRLFPRSVQGRAREAFNEVERTLQGWVLGKIVSMTAVGLLTYIGLAIIGLPMALILGLLAGLLEFVPIIGPFLAFVPAVLIAFTQGSTQALWVVGVYVIIQQVEGNLILPMVYRRSVDLPPAITITAVFVAAAAFGVLGMMVATPLAAVAMVLVKMLYLDDALDQSVSVPSDS